MSETHSLSIQNRLKETFLYFIFLIKIKFFSAATGNTFKDDFAIVIMKKSTWKGGGGGGGDGDGEREKKQTFCSSCGKHFGKIMDFDGVVAVERSIVKDCVGVVAARGSNFKDFVRVAFGKRKYL